MNESMAPEPAFRVTYYDGGKDRVTYIKTDDPMIARRNVTWLYPLCLVERVEPVLKSFHFSSAENAREM
jgi:hypothetical protein